MIALEDIASEDVIAASVWGGFSLVSGVKFVILAASDAPAASMLGPILGTVCGAFIGYRHVQNLAMIARAKIVREQRRDEMEHEREMVKLGRKAKTAIEFDSELPFDCKKTAKPSEDTVDLK